MLTHLRWCDPKKSDNQTDLEYLNSTRCGRVVSNANQVQTTEVFANINCKFCIERIRG